MRRFILLFIFLPFCVGWSVNKPMLGVQVNWGHPLSQDLVGYWIFNEGSGSTVFDLSGNQNTGSFGGNPTWVPGKFGSAIDFDGDGDYIDFGNPPSLEIAYPISIAFSINPTDAAQYRRVLTKSGGNGRPFDFRFNPEGTIQFRSEDDGYIVSTTISTGIWTHFVFVHDGSTAYVYKNGVFANSNPGSAPGEQSSFHWYLGCRDGTGNWFNGKFGHLMIFNHVLSAAEIAQLYLEPFCMLERAPSCALWYAPAGQVVSLGGSSIAQSSLSAAVKVAREISGSINPLADLATLVKLIKKLLGTSTSTADVTALLKPTLRITATLDGLAGISGSLTLTGEVVLGGIINAVSALISTATLTYKLWFSVSLETERKWLKEVLFSGMTANAFKLGTVLSLGWFWMRQADCSVLYRGLSMEQIDFANILAVAEQDACTISPPSYLPHSSGSTYFYVIRRFNNCGYQEQSLSAAVKLSIEANGKLAQPKPNNLFACRFEQIAGNRIQLLWFYCPLEQGSEPVCFKVYDDGGTGQINYENPLAAIGYQGRKFYRWQSGALDEGRYLFAVRAEDAAGIENTSSARLRIQPGTVSPNVIDILGVVTV